MQKSPLHILIVGLSVPQHAALISDCKRVDNTVRINEQPLSASEFKSVLLKSSVDTIFIKRKPEASLDSLYPVLKKNNPDCIVVELIEPPVSLLQADELIDLQSCKIIFDRSHAEFYLALQFVMQYTRLKIDFRRCKSLLFLSERRASRLVNSSSVAIAYLHQGKILHANIPFLVMFKADSVKEFKRFPLLKLIDDEEHKIFASYLSEVRQSPEYKTELTLTLKRVTGAPFYAKVYVSPVVIRDQRCYQMWVEELPQDSKPEMIPVAKSLNVWDMPMEQSDTIQVNPFDRVLSKSGDQKYKETNVDVMLDALQHDELVQLRQKELYVSGQGALNYVLLDLDVMPDEFKKINTLLGKMPEVSSNPKIYGQFWDQLLYRMVCDELLHESSNERVYLVNLSVGMITDTESVMWLFKMLQLLKSKSIQLMLLVDAQISMNRIPQTQKVIDVLRRSGCKIALNNFSVDTTPLFLYRRIQPEVVFLDSEWLDVLKEKPDGNMFLSRFVQQIEGRGVSVFIPHAIQKSQNRLLVLSGASFGQEKTAQDCA
ncbi:EAL domain-containing protein [Leucothrix pacifica]|uniref:EAL domain-containing protein n=1 Tax=Leucothrix pacifica TaxID=1247513 RepID=A0A317CRL3_9GAMM|nr:EAL domain-containing protein [Leucothrix pacifica]PWQ99070.1 hypothetical protein DKW60_06415 [Leucothrix pacifica]